MNEVSELKEEGKKVDSAYMIFLSEYSKDKCFGFVEGRDDPSFYRNLIYSVIPSDRDVRLIPCGNKNQVKKTYGKVDWNNISSKQVVFFMDRDYSDIIDDDDVIISSNVYLTDDYSIENSIICEKTLDSLLRDFGFASVPQTAIDEIKKLFLEQKEEFERKFKNVIVHTACWKRKREKVDLDEFKISALFDIKKGVLNVNKSDEEIVEELYHQCKVGNSCSQAELDDIINKINTPERLDHSFRGKYLKVFFIKFTKSIMASHNELGLETTDKVRGINLGDIMTIVAPRCRIPRSLEVFLTNTLQSYLKSLPST